MKHAVESPLHALASSAGARASNIVNTVKNGKDNFGYNVFTGAFEDLVNGGVIEPKKLVRLSLEKAASLAAVMLARQS